MAIQPPSPHARKGNPNGGAPIATISNGQVSSAAANSAARRKSFDSNQKLTYRKVMERVIKRFLLHKQREEQDEIREGDFEELKQDIQMLRFEMMNRLDETRDDLAKSSRLLNEGVLVVGELLSFCTRDQNPLLRDNFHLFKKNFYSTLDQMHSVDSGMDSSSTVMTVSNTPSMLSTNSMPNIAHQIASNRLIPTSASEPSLSSSGQTNSDVNPIQVLKHLSAAHITLSNIAEENEEEENGKRTVSHQENNNNGDEEIEVEARHMSVQTSDADDEVFSLKIWFLHTCSMLFRNGAASFSSNQFASSSSSPLWIINSLIV